MIRSGYMQKLANSGLQGIKILKNVLDETKKLFVNEFKEQKRSCIHVVPFLINNF